MSTFTVQFEGRQLTVECDVQSWGSDTTWSPAFGADGGDGVEFTIDAIYDSEGKDVHLDDETRWRLETHICENCEFDPTDYED